MSIHFKHLDETNQEYFPHFANASSIAFTLLIGSVKTFLHAIYPDIFINNVRNTVDTVEKKTKKHNDTIELLHTDSFVGDENPSNNIHVSNEVNIDNVNTDNINDVDVNEVVVNEVNANEVNEVNEVNMNEVNANEVNANEVNANEVDMNEVDLK